MVQLQPAKQCQAMFDHLHGMTLKLEIELNPLQKSSA